MYDASSTGTRMGEQYLDRLPRSRAYNSIDYSSGLPNAGSVQPDTISESRGTSVGNTTIAAQTPPLTGVDYVQGVDVSNHNGSPRWVNAGPQQCRFAAAKVSEGTTFEDQSYEYNQRQARASGILLSPYHYFWPTLPPRAQADFFIHCVERNGGHLGLLQPSLDFEEMHGATPGQAINNARIFIERINEVWGVKPFLYSYPYFYKRTLGNPQSFKDCPLWIANYDVPSPTLFGGWSTWSIWQWTATSHLQWVDGVVDRDTFNGPYTQLQKFIMKH